MALLSTGVANPGTLSLGSVNPGTLSNVTVAHPGTLSGVTVAHPGTLSIGSTPKAAAPAPAAAPTASSIYGGAPAVPAPVYAPNIDLAAINAQARSAAEANVDPFYTKSLNDFLGQQASEKAQQQAQTATNIKNLQDTLANTTAANAVTGERTTADTAQKEADIAQTADWRQTDQGGQYDMDRIAQAVNQAKSGLTGSGIAGGQQQATQDKFNTTESRQATTDAQAKQAQELSKARTFEDLATSNKLAGQAETKGESQANVDLTNFITNQGFQLNSQKQSLEEQRLQAVARETASQGKLAINNFINSISDPAKRQAAIQAYGGIF